MNNKTIRYYQARSGKSPFVEWFEKIRDKVIKFKVIQRLKRLELGHYGDCKSLGDGVFELRFSIGIRIYFGEVGKTIVVLLIGGNKRSQKKDIDKAKKYWSEYHG